jgi:hypothetical protein
MNWRSGDGLMMIVRHEQQVARPALESVLLIRSGRLADDNHAVTTIGTSRIFGHRGSLTLCPDMQISFWHDILFRQKKPGA